MCLTTILQQARMLQVLFAAILLLSLTATTLAQTVAFEAYSDPSKVVAKANGVIPFTKVVTNIGNGYNALTSSFKVPRDGLYYFVGRLDVSSDYRDLMIAVNGKPQGEANSDGTDNALQVFAVVELKTGDVVDIRHFGDKGFVDGGRETVFIGFRVGCY